MTHSAKAQNDFATTEEFARAPAVPTSQAQPAAQHSLREINAAPARCLPSEVGPLTSDLRELSLLPTANS